MAYTMKGTGANAQRTGTLVVSSDFGSNTIAFTDDYTEVNNANTTIGAVFTGTGATVAIVYTNTSPAGVDGIINFSLSNTEETVV
jgi:hypothetical protein